MDALDQEKSIAELLDSIDHAISSIGVLDPDELGCLMCTFYDEALPCSVCVGFTLNKFAMKTPAIR